MEFTVHIPLDSKKEMPHLKKDKELKDPSKRWGEKSGISNGHLEEKGVEKTVSYIDEWVLVDVGVSHTVVVIVEWDIVIVGLIFRHGLSS